MLQVEERFQPTDTMLVTTSERKLGQSMPLTISEDSDDDLITPKKHRRCMSLPAYLNHKSIMKRRTLDESLHSTYGSEDGMISGRSGSKKSMALQFDKINIREYSRTVGDNPSCSSGPPVSISWEYNILGDMPIDDYEKTRPPRRIQHEMILPRHMREDLLRFEWNASRKDITESVRRNVRIKNQRRTTVNNLGKATAFEEAIESFCRKLTRLLTGQKAVHKQVKDLEDQIDLTNRRRSKLLYLEHNMSQGSSQGGEETAPTPEKSPLVLNGSGDGIGDGSEQAS